MLKALRAAALATTFLAAPAVAPAVAQVQLDIIPSNFDRAPWLGSCGPWLHCDLSEWEGNENPGNEGKLRFFCEASHLNYDDPILFKNQVGATHLHMFLGNTGTNASSDYVNLRTTGGGSCEGGPLNRTAYWMPAMISPVVGKVVKPDFLLFYYVMNRKDHTEFTSPSCLPTHWRHEFLACPQPPIINFPRGLNFITGFNPSGPSVGATDNPITWSCIGASGQVVNGQGSKPVLWDPITPSNGVVGCPAGASLMGGMATQRCWDGVNLSAPNGRSHLSNKVSTFTTEGVCPNTHPILLPFIIVEISFSHNGEDDYKNWHLSSDRFNGATWRNGESLHTDWFGAWDDVVKNDWAIAAWGFPGDGVNCCTIPGSKIMTTFNGALGDGQQLIQNNVVLTATPEAQRYMDIPSIKRRGKMRMR